MVFLDKGFKYESNLCNGCHNLKSLSFNNVANASVKGSKYRIHFCYMSKMMIQT